MVLAESLSDREPIKYAVKTYGVFFIILKVERVVALYFDSVLLFIIIEYRFPKILCRDERSASVNPPTIRPTNGETINVIAIKTPTIIIDKLPLNIFLIKGVN